ncbi:hypothetical protein Tco_0312024 [Tanacetum coccineum]
MLCVYTLDNSVPRSLSISCLTYSSSEVISKTSGSVGSEVYLLYLFRFWICSRFYNFFSLSLQLPFLLSVIYHSETYYSDILFFFLLFFLTSVLTLSRLYPDFSLKLSSFSSFLYFYSLLLKASSSSTSYFLTSLDNSYLSLLVSGNFSTSSLSLLLDFFSMALLVLIWASLFSILYSSADLVFFFVCLLLLEIFCSSALGLTSTSAGLSFQVCLSDFSFCSLDFCTVETSSLLILLFFLLILYYLLCWACNFSFLSSSAVSDSSVFLSFLSCEGSLSFFPAFFLSFYCILNILSGNFSSSFLSLSFFSKLLSASSVWAADSAVTSWDFSSDLLLLELLLLLVCLDSSCLGLVCILVLLFATTTSLSLFYNFMLTSCQRLEILTTSSSRGCLSSLFCGFILVNSALDFFQGKLLFLTSSEFLWLVWFLSAAGILLSVSGSVESELLVLLLLDKLLCLWFSG